MSHSKHNNRKTIRKPFYQMNSFHNKVLFLYGKIMGKHEAKGYCTLHKCYLASYDITEKKCKRKKCKYFEGRYDKDVI
jgi:homogentisate 1,2-dioxygenase